jgi:hypothetical protein
MNKNFIKLNEEIIELKSELRKRSIAYLKSKETNVKAESIEGAINGVFNRVMGRRGGKNLITWSTGIGVTYFVKSIAGTAVPASAAIVLIKVSILCDSVMGALHQRTSL